MSLYETKIILQEKIKKYFSNHNTKIKDANEILQETLEFFDTLATWDHPNG